MDTGSKVAERAAASLKRQHYKNLQVIVHMIYILSLIIKPDVT